jgi:hypothetical protein
MMAVTGIMSEIQSCQSESIAPCVGLVSQLLCFIYHTLLAYADDVNIVEGNIDTIQRNTKALLDASKEVGLEVNPEKTKYMLVSRCQKAGQRQSIKIGNRSFESVEKLKYLGTTLTDQNFIHEEIKRRLNSGILTTIRFRVFCHPACCPGI